VKIRYLGGLNVNLRNICTKLLTLKYISGVIFGIPKTPAVRATGVLVGSLFKEPVFGDHYDQFDEFVGCVWVLENPSQEFPESPFL
jgi:hypothetical protein